VRAAVRAFLALLATAVAASAVQPLARIAPDVLFLPGFGVALNARNGHVLWRTPRFDGGMQTDGHGLLLISWVSDIDKIHHLRVTRVCRLDAFTGRRLWCRDWARMEQWKLDTGGRVWYARTLGRLQVVGVGHGNVDRTFHLPLSADLTLLPLPAGGVAVLERRKGRAAELLTYTPGAAALEDASLPAGVYPFRGDGRGLLFYVRQKGEYLLAAPLRRLLGPRRTAAAAAPVGAPELAGEAFLEPSAAAAAPANPFPRASLDDHAFLFTDWVGRRPILRGGTYGGAFWQAPRHGRHPQLALTRSTAVMLEPTGHGAGRLSGFALATGAARYSLVIPGDDPAMTSDSRDVVLQSRTAIRLVDGASGRVLWSAPNHEGPLAATPRSSLVFWESGGRLAALARDNGRLLWRVRFVQHWSRHWF
jgi:hypothetical protein